MTILGAFLFLGVCAALIAIGSIIFDPWSK